jgi:hypothetical protein
VNNLRIFCAGRKTLPVEELRAFPLRIERLSATCGVLFQPRDDVADLTTAILYNPAAEPYYPIARLLWRTNNNKDSSSGICRKRSL